MSFALNANALNWRCRDVAWRDPARRVTLNPGFTFNGDYSMSKASKLVAGAMLIGFLSATPLAQAKGVGGRVFSDIPATATAQVIKYSVS